MSKDVESAAADMMCCAACGIKANDDIKLKKCTACHLVKYCGVKCQKEHRPQHKRECKKRAAELHDEILFKQPENSHLGDCPICCLPLSIGKNKASTLMTCCSNMICKGCSYTNAMREIRDSLDQRCPYCRHPMPNSRADNEKNAMRRLEANDPVAMREVGKRLSREGDYKRSVDYWAKASELGDLEAHYLISYSYRVGEGVQKDIKKAIYHAEQAAIGGHPGSRFNLGSNEFQSGKVERAIKHWIIASNHGHDDSLRMLRESYNKRFVGKEDFAAALRAHQAALDATKSPQREAGEAFYANQNE